MSQLLKPEILSALLIFLFGLSFIVLIRPLNIPDEANHFMRAYEISEGKIFVSSADTDGCLLETKAVTFSTDLLESSLPMSVAEFMHLDRGGYSIKRQLGVPLNENERVDVCSRQTQANSPIGYIPQSFAIAALRQFNASPILMDYAARVAILMTWTVFIVAAIRVIPIRKWAILGIALLPMAIQQSISIGADVLSIAPTVLFMAILVRSYYEDRKDNALKDLITLSTLVAIATLAKPVMIVLTIPLLMYSYRSEKNLKIFKFDIPARVFLKIGAIFMPIIAYAIWSILAGYNNVSATDIFRLAEEKAEYIHSAPLDSIRLFVVQSLNYVFHGMSLDQFGAFGWFTYSIPETWRFIGIATTILILLVGYSERVRPLKYISMAKIKTFNRIVVVTALGIVAANIFTLYIIWTPLDAYAVEGVQFRYFLAALFVAACPIGLRFISSSQEWYRNFIIVNAFVFYIISVLTITGVLASR